MYRRFSRFVVYILTISMLAGTYSVPAMAASTDSTQAAAEEVVLEEAENEEALEEEDTSNDGAEAQDSVDGEEEGENENEPNAGENPDDPDTGGNTDNPNVNQDPDDPDTGGNTDNPNVNQDPDDPNTGGNTDDPNAGQNPDDPDPDVTKIDLSDAELFLEKDTFDYDGTVPHPEVLVSLNGITLSKDIDYEVVYDESAEGGLHVVTVNGIGEYTGTATVEYSIVVPQQKVSGTMSYTKRLGDGSFDLDAVTDGDGMLVYGSSNNGIVTVTSGGTVSIKGVGTAVISVYAKETEHYKKSDTIKITVTVLKKQQKVTVTSTYTKALGQAAFTVKAATDGDGTLKYSSSNKNVATVSSAGKITIKGVGIAKIKVYATETATYAKSATKTITIKVGPKKMAVSSVANTANNKITVKWKKQSGVSGYQIQFSAKKDFSKAKSATVAASATSKVIGGLTKNATYYVRIRAYKTVSGQKLYSTWSAAKSVKITKGTVKTFGKTPSISLNAHDGEFKNTISWNKLSGASGYQVYVKKGTNGTWNNVKTTTSNSFTHAVTHGIRYYYKVRAYQDLADGSRIYGKFSAQKDMLQSYKPQFQVIMSGDTEASTGVFVLYISNTGVSTMRIYSRGALLRDYDSYKFNRDLYLTQTTYSSPSLDEARYIDIKPNTGAYIAFACKGEETWYDAKSRIYYEFRYDGVSYVGCSSDYFGTSYGYK